MGCLEKNVGYVEIYSNTTEDKSGIRKSCNINF